MLNNDFEDSDEEILFPGEPIHEFTPEQLEWMQILQSKNDEIADLKKEISRLKEFEWMYKELCK